MAKWTAADIPDQSGRVVVVTGATSGIGQAAAEAFAARGADTILAVRDTAKGDRLREVTMRRHPSATMRVMRVDLADLGSIRDFAARADAELPRIDVLLNNAGLGMQRRRAETKDGFERMFGTNHLGAFATTGLLLPALLRARAPRVVAIASLAHRSGFIDFDDLQGVRRYGGGKAYSQSKLANLLFTMELDRRSKAAHAPLIAVAAHPGIAATGFVGAIGLPPLITALAELGLKVVGQSQEKGALPGLYASTMPDVKGGDYFGPDGLNEMNGWPKRAAISPRAQNADLAGRLWQVSEELTGASYAALSAR